MRQIADLENRWNIAMRYGRQTGGQIKNFRGNEHNGFCEKSYLGPAGSLTNLRIWVVFLLGFFNYFDVSDKIRDDETMRHMRLAYVP